MVLVILALIVAADPTPTPPAVPIKVHDGVKVTSERIEDAKAKARRAYPGKIDHIYVGQLVHPFGNMGFRVYFKDEVIDTYVIERHFAIQLLPKKGAMTVDPALIPNDMFVTVKRVFPLEAASVQIALPDDLSYRQVHALLIAIEQGTYSVRKEEPGVYSGLDDKIELSQISGLEYKEETKTIEVWTSSRRFGGRVFKFEVQAGGFKLISAAHWVS